MDIDTLTKTYSTDIEQLDGLFVTAKVESQGGGIFALYANLVALPDIGDAHYMLATNSPHGEGLLSTHERMTSPAETWAVCFYDEDGDLVAQSEPEYSRGVSEAFASASRVANR